MDASDKKAERLAAALRANLKRRKAQARELDADDAGAVAPRQRATNDPTE